MSIGFPILAQVHLFQNNKSSQIYGGCPEYLGQPLLYILIHFGYFNLVIFLSHITILKMSDFYNGMSDFYNGFDMAVTYLCIDTRIYMIKFTQHGKIQSNTRPVCLSTY